MDGANQQDVYNFRQQLFMFVVYTEEAQDVEGLTKQQDVKGTFGGGGERLRQPEHVAADQQPVYIVHYCEINRF